MEQEIKPFNIKHDGKQYCVTGTVDYVDSEGLAMTEKENKITYGYDLARGIDYTGLCIRKGNKLTAIFHGNEAESIIELLDQQSAHIKELEDELEKLKRPIDKDNYIESLKAGREWGDVEYRDTQIIGKLK